MDMEARMLFQPRLNVAAQHQGMVGRRHVKPDDILQLLHELRIARDLEGLDQVRLEPVGTPHLEHRGSEMPSSPASLRVLQFVSPWDVV